MLNFIKIPGLIADQPISLTFSDFPESDNLHIVELPVSLSRKSV